MGKSNPALHWKEEESRAGAEAVGFNSVLEEFVLSEVTSPAEDSLEYHTLCFLDNGEDGFVESEDHNPENLGIRFDVKSVVKELSRGKRLMCNFCQKKGATVGCEERACRRSYHYFCALCDDAAVETDQVNGIYRYSPCVPDWHCQPRGRLPCAANKKRRRTLTCPTITEDMSTEETAEENHLRILKRKNNRHKVRIEFVRKCKQAGLLDDIFEEMLDTLHLAQEKLMDDNTSETEYEETVMALFDCGLFENILTNVYSGTEEKIQKLLENRKRLDHKIELLQDLKKVILPTPENIANITIPVDQKQLQTVTQSVNCLRRTQGLWELELTYGEQAPHDSRGGEAGEHIVSAGKVGEVGEGHGLAPALAPHVHLATLGLGRRRVRRVAGGDLHNPAGTRNTVRRSQAHLVVVCDVNGFIGRRSEHTRFANGSDFLGGQQAGYLSQASGSLRQKGRINRNTANQENKKGKISKDKQR
ncbi:hypothetical protein IHE44_0005381 [Lamprotornis superbus]|uniref:PHD-type domain-containing protein n=1 Tax=Lamprotornis superbus TaxID=245042 RepID=A0A835NNM4_9PASS|nr:hypothetical protein IHE44_0005381 [Lamprotornis superbus]